MISVVKFFTVAVIIILCVIFYPHLNPQNLSAFIKGNSIEAPLLFIGICAIRPILFFLPSLGLTVIGGLLFGAFRGTVYVAIGGALSTVVGFYFARWLGRNAVEKLMQKNDKIRQMEEWSQRHGKNAILLMRLFNLPWDMVSYWAGLSSIKFRDFYIASLIPLIPISFLYTYFGSKLFTPTSAGFVISLTIIFIIGSIPYILSRLKKRTDG
ncbi:MAG: TVP38/TMEM64 family protein [Nitrospirae bacterium]|nr:TVP38/TMEM64 family protein [Nitrospirota bacterium]